MRTSVILMEIKDEGNLGAIARICDNFNVDHLILINPQCDIFSDVVYQRANRSRKFIDNSITIKNVSESYKYVDFIIALTGRLNSKRSLARNIIRLDDVISNLVNVSSNVGILLGRESRGLTNEELLECNVTATIPLNSTNNILNISHATAIALYEINLKVQIKPDETLSNENLLINKDQRKLISQSMGEILRAINFSNRSMNSSLIIFNTVIARSYLSNMEANTFISMIQAINDYLISITNSDN
jgi:tRNA/rRNA methyltransferase